MFWRLISQVQVLKVGVPDVGFKPLLLRGKLGVVSSPWTVGGHARGGTYDKAVSQSPLPISMWVFSHSPDV